MYKREVRGLYSRSLKLFRLPSMPKKYILVHSKKKTSFWYSRVEIRLIYVLAFRIEMESHFDSENRDCSSFDRTPDGY